MSGYIDFEAVESEEEEELELPKKKNMKKVVQENSDENNDEEEGDEEKFQNELQDLIDDNSIDESDIEDAEKKSKKRRKSHDKYYDDQLEDDDFDLIEENLGITIKRTKRYKRLKKVQDPESDDDEELKVSKERETIANELFDNESSYEDDGKSEISNTLRLETCEGISEEESSDLDDFIVDEDGKSIGKARQKRQAVDSNPALKEAQDIFGIDFQFDEFEEYSENELDEIDDEDSANKHRESKTRKQSRKNIFDVYEPFELKRKYFTDIDNKIRNTDIPERMQLRTVPVTSVAKGSDELDLESKWIYQHAFNCPKISVQTTELNIHQKNADKEPQIVEKIKKVLDMIRNNYLEVPFISFYRKECFAPELNMNDLWKIYKFDAKWYQLRQRKANLLVLFEKMQNFQSYEIMKNPDAPLSDSFRLIKEDDIDRLKKVETDEELNDVYRHFMLYYCQDISVMLEMAQKKKYEAERLQKMAKRQQQSFEAQENSEDLTSKDKIEIKDDEEENKPEDTIKQAVRIGPYTIWKRAGLDTFAKKFGLTPEQFAENLRDNYQRHEVNQELKNPNIIALDYLGPKFKTSDEVLKAVQFMVAYQLARDPLVKTCVREICIKQSKVTVKPTKKGITEIDENHPIYTMKYLKNKPVNELCNDQFLKLSLAETDKLITITFNDNFDGIASSDYINEVKQLYIKDEFSKNVKDWNALRMECVEIALTKLIIPDLKKELKAKLLAESKEYVMRICCQKMYNWIKIAPYSCDYSQEDDEWDTSEGLRIMAIAYVSDYTQAAFACIIAPNGLCTGFLRLPHLLKRKNSIHGNDKILKEADLLAMKNFISEKKPHVIVVGGESREAMMILSDIKVCLMTLSSEEQFPVIPVEILDNNLAKIYAKSNRGTAEFREYPETLREAISLARRLQDPLIEFSQLCTIDEEILCLTYHKLQNQLPQDELLENLYLEFVNRVNEVGLDINKVIQQPHMENLVQFICGLGPRKGAALIKILKQTIRKLENRSQLVTVCCMGPKIYINCAGFIKIDTDMLSDGSETYIEVLDGTRIHPESYEWAKKMAVDALEYDDEDMNTAAAVEEIMNTPDRLQELDLEAFAEELSRQGCGNKCATLYNIKSELIKKYKDLRPPYQSSTPEELFNILTKETPETFYIGKLVLATVIDISFRKPDRNQLDQANPMKDNKTGLWQCPFCLANEFAEMSDVWNHFDTGSCKGKANGVRLRLENGLSGYIHIKNLSDSLVENLLDRVRVKQVIHCRVIKIDVEKFSIECTSKTSDLKDQNNEYRPVKDPCYDTEVEEEMIKLEDETKKAKERQVYVKRLNFHPTFYNINYVEAQKLLQTMKLGDAIVRPSSKGSDHLTMTWKVTENIYQHIDIKEEGKDNVFSLGRKLWIGDEVFEDLDEIIARHINPMASYVTELMEYKKYKIGINGVTSEAEKVLRALKTAIPNEIPYLISASKHYPGKFLLAYLPRISCKYEYISVTPVGLRFRNQIFTRIDDLIRWFKQHFRDPIPIQNTPKIPYGALQTPHSIPNIDPETIQRVAQNLPNHMLHSLSQAAHQTPASHAGTLMNTNTPYTPLADKPSMTSYQTFFMQPMPQYGQQASNHQFLHPGTINQYSVPVNNTGNDSFNWGSIATAQSSDGSMQQRSTPYSHRSDSSNNAHNNIRRNTRDNMRGITRQNLRGRGQNTYQRLMYSYSSTNNTVDNSFDWESSTQTTSSTRQTSATNNEDDDTFNWDTISETSQSKPTFNNINDMSNWEISTNSQLMNHKLQRSTSYSRYSTPMNNEKGGKSRWQRNRDNQGKGNNKNHNSSYLGGQNMTRRLVSSSSSFQSAPKDTDDDDSYDWGTIQAQPENQNTGQESSTYNGDKDIFDAETTADIADQSSSPTNYTRKTSDKQTGARSQRSPYSRYLNSKNNIKENGQSLQRDRNNRGRNRDISYKNSSYSRRLNSIKNKDHESSGWRNKIRKCREQQNMHQSPTSDSCQSAPTNNVDDSSFDWGIVTQTPSTENSSQQLASSLWDETSVKNEKLINNTNNDKLDWQTDEYSVGADTTPLYDEN